MEARSCCPRKPVDVADLNGFSVFGYDACGPRADTLETTNPVRNGDSVTVVIMGTPDANEVSGGAVRAGAVSTTTPGSGPITPNVADSIAASGGPRRVGHARPQASRLTWSVEHDAGADP